MNKYALIAVFSLSVILACTSCVNEDIEDDIIESPFIQVLTLNNYPKVDGSTSQRR